MKKQKWVTTTAAQATTPIVGVKSVRPDTTFSMVLEEMRQDHVNELPVIAEGVL